LFCIGIQPVNFPCSVIEYSAKNTTVGWDAYLKIGICILNIDLYIIGRGIKQYYFKGNMFRIDKDRTKPTRHLAYNPAYN
jgi:hypothetical protein